MNKLNSHIHQRRSIRLKGYDYSHTGLYFITICVQRRECLFGEIFNGRMILNHAGQLAQTEWLKLSGRFKNIELHEFVVMPNHFHGIGRPKNGKCRTIGNCKGTLCGRPKWDGRPKHGNCGSTKRETTIDCTYLHTFKQNHWGYSRGI